VTDQIKEALRMIPYGFYAMTSRNGDDVNGMVSNWVTQVAFEPRLVAWGLQKTSYSYGLVEKGKVFTLNVYAKEDEEAIKPLTKSRSKDPEKMEKVEYTEAPKTGCPVLKEAAAYVEFEVVDIIDVGGDHDIVVGEAVNAGVNKSGEAGDTLTLPHIGWSYAG
jgi:flavin reductase (DIM6/NTAB) family NADH-FMN oxidoreductase RutF